MSEFVCEGCEISFKDDRGLSIHRQFCKSMRSTAADALKSAKAAWAAKRKRLLKEQLNQPAHEFENHDFPTGLDDEPIGLFDMPLELPAGSKRKKRLPKRFTDHVPVSSRSTVLPAASLPHLLDFMPPPEPPAEPLNATSPSDDQIPAQLRTSFTTNKTDYGLFRIYPDKPADNPDDFLGLEDLCDSLNLSVPETRRRLPSLPSCITEMPFKSMYAPFKNATSYLLTLWSNREVKEKTNEEIDELVRGVLLHPEFNRDDLKFFSAKRENDRLDYQDEPEEHNPQAADGWREGSVRIKLPSEDRTKRIAESAAPEFEVGGIHYRPLLDIICKALDDPNAPPFHFTPYKEYWKPSDDSQPQRVYGELYSADAWLEAHEEVRALPRNDEIDNFVLPIMLYSDSTHLANFGTASLWPLYMYLGGQSKYFRGKTSNSTCHHVAYIPQLPATVQDAYKQHYGRAASAEVLTHLRRELVHAVLSLVLLYPKFLDVYMSGFEFTCPDKVIRRLFPRFMVYSADYPERMLIATLRVLGSYPCPTCFIPKKYVHQMGTHVDSQRRAHKRLDDEFRRSKITKTRKWIFEQGVAVESKKVKDILHEGSLIPVHNAFSAIAQHGFDFYRMFVPDIMHEYELGVWRNIFIHLLRILVAVGGDSISILNSRYHAVPTFGTDTIRRFTDNTAAMKKLAARDFEDMLQCALPVFEDLLPKRHNKLILDLIFILAMWHALAKLRIHTDTTLYMFEDATRALGAQVRLFKKSTAGYATRELQKEVQARGRRQMAAVGKGKIPSERGATADPKRKVLNLNIPKFHQLALYVEAIRRFGTIDSYTTQIGEMQHKRVKRLYGRTNKRNTSRSISRLEERNRRLREIQTRIEHTKNPSFLSSVSEPLAKTRPDEHYHMAESKKNYIHMNDWISENENDLALKNFLDDLRSHVLSRLLSRDEDSTFTPEEIDGFEIKGDRLYCHKVLRINYTTYDIRRSQDTINPSTHPDIMVLSSDSEVHHPYAYGRVVGLYHAEVAYTGPGSTNRSYRRMDIAFIRWFQFDSSYTSGFSAKRLPRVQFLHYSNPSAFGFLDPECIIRATHLIPAFAYNQTRDLLPPSLVRRPTDNDQDFCYYYVNIFVDRDMFMRYRGGGIGHKAFQHLDNILLGDSVTEREDEGLDLDEEVLDAESEDEEDIETDISDESDNEEADESDGFADL